MGAGYEDYKDEYGTDAWIECNNINVETSGQYEMAVRIYSIGEIVPSHCFRDAEDTIWVVDATTGELVE